HRKDCQSVCNCSGRIGAKDCCFVWRTLTKQRIPSTRGREFTRKRLTTKTRRLEEGLQMVALNHFVSSCPRGDAPGSSRETDQSVFSVLTNPQTDLVFAAKLSATRQSPLVQPARFARLTDYAQLIRPVGAIQKP